jgi:glycosyltransferase involved in cell wall biosynthesis
MQKLVFIIPKIEKNEATHFAYLPDFISEIGKDFKVKTVIEKGILPWDFFFPIRLPLLMIRLLWLRACGYRDFYVHYSFAGALVASIIIKLFGGRVFYWNCGEPWKYRRNFLRENFERRVYKMITFLVTGTEELAMQYSAHYGIPMEKIKVMPNWIDLTKTQEQKNKKTLEIKDDQKTVLFVHRLSERKGANYLPEILRELQDENIVMLVVGDGPERHKIESRIKTYELETKARFLGWVPQNKILKYFAAADVFIMPSNEEGFPHVLLEAMAVGVPFVATNVGGVKDIVPESMKSNIVEPGDVRGFASRVKDLIRKDEESIDKISAELREFAGKYSLRNSVEIFKKIISNTQ